MSNSENGRATDLSLYVPFLPKLNLNLWLHDLKMVLMVRVTMHAHEDYCPSDVNFLRPPLLILKSTKKIKTFYGPSVLSLRPEH